MLSNSTPIAHSSQMATDKPRVAAYLSNQNYQQLKKFCSEQGIKGLSTGIDLILSQYFGTDSKSSRGASALGEGVTRAEVSELISQECSAYFQRLEAVEDELKKRLA